MSDVEEGRPLTRREIRLREMASGTLQIEETPSPEPVLEASASEVVSSEQSAEQAAALTPRQQRKLLRMQERKQARQEAADESHGTADDSHDTADDSHDTADDSHDTADDSHDQLLEGQSPTANADPVPNSASQARSEVLAAAIAAIEIPLHDEHGQLRSRRELRELRDQAEADLRASFGTDAPSDPDAATHTDAAVHTDADVNTEAALAVEDDLVDDDFVDDDFVDDDTEDPGLEAAEQADDSADIDDSDDIETDLDDIETDLGDIETDRDETDQVNVIQVVDVANDADPAMGAQVPEPKTEIPTYTFPDISPIDEAPSVFGDPALRMIRSDAQGAEPEADFDDLIARAVVQEGAASPTNTSALILPSMPEDSLLSAPVQATGEILFTGSITLPRSLSETGSHLSVPDVAHDDHHGVIDELHPADPTITTGHMAPVSAVRAVSAQASTNSLVSNTPTDKSKMPLILISAGGALVLVAAGLVIWAAATGLFG